jgi:hypothetical protein
VYFAIYRHIVPQSAAIQKALVFLRSEPALAKVRRDASHDGIGGSWNSQQPRFLEASASPLMLFRAIRICAHRDTAFQKLSLLAGWLILPSGDPVKVSQRKPGRKFLEPLLLKAKATSCGDFHQF